MWGVCVRNMACLSRRKGEEKWEKDEDEDDADVDVEDDVDDDEEEEEEESRQFTSWILTDRNLGERKKATARKE